ncbi:hypothetical protein EMIHUDRAFT_207577 [Emiliania huxleyi CCMP1516]|uniref:Secreted protein n=2 Tax=Emiliania huxleyi TaxID=2903 RepID=A0A0D3JDP2_EMIH1|nr:hypothetical protein EMIHUDRAFT_207577 [Emiliania huxleyi CCMP1516]EOD21627.1 hypothetical protein EMIHUDRAFT_207577 [Emiliania huxleyi CCMP1516]|eukprot:XP_005774056.1 hypothetical protein EMIHUDRAFT_207577 [Emiliania huxleyi CCMP1516]
MILVIFAVRAVLRPLARPSRTAVTIYPTSIVDGKLENCASKGMPDWLLLAVRPGGIHCQLRRRSDSVDGRPSAWLVPSRPAGDAHSLLG